MRKKQNEEPIRDDELKKFLELDFSSRLKEVLLENEIGKRIKTLESLGFKISIDKTVDTYISQEGYTMDHVGNLYMDEQALYGIYVAQEDSISQSLNIDISSISDIGVLKKIAYDPEYKKNVQKYGSEIAMDIHIESQDKINDMKAFLNANDLFGLKENHSEENKLFFQSFHEFKSTAEIMNTLKDKSIFNFTEEQVNKMVEKNKEQTINTSIENKDTTQGLRCLYKLRDTVNQSHNGEIITETEIQDILNELKKVFGNFQYKEFVVDEAGNVDVEKAVDFLNKWENGRNEAKLFESLNTLARSDFSKIDKDNLPKFLVFFKRAIDGNDINNKNMTEAIARKIRDSSGIDLFTDEKIDVEKISKLYSELRDGADIDEEIAVSEWNSNTAEGKLNRIDQAIDNDLGIRRESRDQINAAKELANELIEKRKNKKMMAIEQILLEEKCTPEQIVALFYEFRCEEVANSKRLANTFGPNQLKISSEHGIAKIIENYMIAHKEQFKDYVTDNNCLRGTAIYDFIQKNEFSNLQRAGIAGAHKKIEQKVNDIDKQQDTDLKKSKMLLDLIDNLRGRPKDEISEKEKIVIFEQAAKLGKSNILSKVVMRELQWIDGSRLRTLYSKVQEDENSEPKGLWFKRAMSDLRTGIIDLPKLMLRKKSNKSNNETLAGRINIMARKAKEQKDKSSKKQEIPKEPKVKENDNSTNFPAVKKVTILDRIKDAFGLNKNTKKVENDKVINANLSDSESVPNNQNDEIENGGLTPGEKSDKTIAANIGNDFTARIKVETPIVVSNDDSNQVSNEPDEIENKDIEIGE